MNAARSIRSGGSPTPIEATRDSLLCDFAAKLDELKVAAGNPPLGLLQRTGTRLPASTISDVLNGKSAPTLDFVLDFVGACRTLAREAGHPVDPALVDMDTWRAAWHQLAVRLGEIRRRRGRARVLRPPPDELTRPPPGVPRQLPPDIAVFTGRSALLAELDDVLESIDGRAGLSPIVVISGMAGVGKTTLAVRWAHRVRRHFPDGDLFTDLRGFRGGQPTSAQDAIVTFLHAIGGATSPKAADLAELAASFRTAMSGRRMLVVLDNAFSAEQVRPLLPAAPGSVVVITSRDSMSGLAAHEGITRIDVGPMTSGESNELLTRILGERAVESPDEIDRIGALCGHLPLALRIVAERTSMRRHATLRSLGDELQWERRHPPAQVDAADGAAHLIPNAAFSWSYAALPATVQPSFRLLGLHPTPELSLQAAAALFGHQENETRRRLDLLVTARLVDDIDRDRYRIHDLISVYARTLACQEDSGQARKAATGRLLRWYLLAVDAADRRLLPSRRERAVEAMASTTGIPRHAAYSDALRWCDLECANVVAATHLAAAAGEDDIAWRLPFAFMSYFSLRKPWQQWIDTCTVAVESARRISDEHGIAGSLNGLGIAYRETRRYERATACFEEALAIYRGLADLAGQAIVIGNLGATSREQGASHLALARYWQGYAISRQIDDRRTQSIDLHNIADALQELGCYDEALPHAERALALAIEVGDEAAQGATLTVLGQVYAGLGSRRDAIDCFRQARVCSHNAGDPQGVAIALYRFGSYLQALGLASDGRTALAEALEIFAQLRDPQEAEVRTLLDQLARAD